MNTGASSHLAENTDNNVSVDFDAYGFSVEDYQTRRLLLRCDSTDDLYPVTPQTSTTTPFALLTLSSTTWHRHLGHPSDDVLRRLQSSSLISCNKSKLSTLCHACQLEDQFPFGSMTPDTPPSYDFLLPLNAPLHPNITPLTLPTIAPNTTPPTPVPIPPTTTSLTSPTHSTQAQSTAAQHTIPIPSHLHSPQAQSTATQHTIPITTPPGPTAVPNTTTNNRNPLTNRHSMVTRAKARISKPLERMYCHVTTTSPLPRSHLHALRDPNGHKAMVDEYNALISNGTWALVPRPTNVNIIRSMWLFKHKFNPDGSLSRYKARLVANVYMHQPPEFVDYSHPDYVCHLQRSLYGLKQAPRTWFQQFSSFITRVGFQHSKSDTSLFVYHKGLNVAYLLLYVDDIILTASSTALLQRIITLLHSEFAMSDLGSLNYFLGISVQRSKSGLFLSQSKFADDPTLYRSLACALQYLTFTRPDISYDVQQICLHMHDPRDLYFTALKRILRYVRGTIDHGLQLHVSSTTQLIAYTHADWSAKRQVTLSRSSAETAWLRNLLLELHAPLSAATLVYCPVQHRRTKHIEIDIHFVREYVASGQVRVLHVPFRFQFDAILKGVLIFFRKDVEALTDAVSANFTLRATFHKVYRLYGPFWYKELRVGKWKSIRFLCLVPQRN
ncbi:ribonuclease H-like domain-containing protein [Tanacetum coccineum]